MFAPLIRTLAYGAGFRLLKAAAILVAVAAGSGTAAAEPVRLVALGDSLTAGYGLPEGQGFVPQLDAWLAARGRPDVEVVNAGVSGDTTAGGRARLDWALAGGADAAIVALGGNDLLRGIDPAHARENLAAIMQRMAERGIPVLLSALPAPLNYGPDYKAEFDAIYPALAADYGALYDPNFIEGVAGRPELIQPDGLHPNAEGVAVMVERIGPRVLELLERVE